MQSHFDQAFRSHHPERFETSFQKSGGTSLLINGSSTSDPSSVLPVWADHFSNLGTSLLSTNPSLQEISNTIPEVEIATLVEEERILDVSFLPEEVDAALNHLTRSSSAGPDSLSPQHIIYAGPLLKSWLGKVFDAIIYEFRSNSLSVQNGYHRSHLQGQGEGPPPT